MSSVFARGTQGMDQLSGTRKRRVYTHAMLPPPDIRPGPDPQTPPGPRLLRRLLSRGLFGTGGRQNPADFVRSVAAKFGDVTKYQIGPQQIYLFSHPELITDFFGKDAPHHHRNFVMQRSREVLGHGLLTSEEPLHMRQRRLAQPAFLRSRIASYGQEIGRRAEARSRSWKPGPCEMHHQMLELALDIVGKTLFDLDRVEQMHEIEDAVNAFMAFMPLAFLPFGRLVQRLPLPVIRRMNRGNRMLNDFIYGLLAERRAEGTDRGDLLSMLLAAADEGGSMTDEQVRDECVTIILAGHETTANALSFALDLLARNPETQERLAAESDAVLGDRPPTAADYALLPYATQVFAEAMRLYPPVWITGRMAAEPYEIAGYPIPKGAALMASQYAVHRDPRWWPDPDRFDAERFSEVAKAGRPRNVYFPFGGGSRQCIGEGLAWMEGTLILAAVARDWRLTLPPGAPAQPALDPAITLRPKNGIPLLLERR